MVQETSELTLYVLVLSQTAMTAELPNIDEYLKAIPMKRLGTPEDIAKVVKFLALDTDYVTGQAIEVAGGLMI